MRSEMDLLVMNRFLVGKDGASGARRAAAGQQGAAPARA
jgi:hypothetical protein